MNARTAVVDPARKCSNLVHETLLIGIQPIAIISLRETYFPPERASMMP